MLYFKKKKKKKKKKKIHFINYYYLDQINLDQKSIHFQSKPKVFKYISIFQKKKKKKKKFILLIIIIKLMCKNT